MDVKKNNFLAKEIYVIPSYWEIKYANETTCHTFLKFTIPLVNIMLINFLKQVKASFEKGTQPGLKVQIKPERVHLSIKDSC